MVRHGSALPSLRVLVAVAALASSSARAQGIATGIAADRFVPAVGPGAMISVEGGGAPDAGEVAMAVSLGYLARPLTLGNRVTGEVVSRPVSAAVDGDLAAEVGLTRWLALGLGIPITLASRGQRLAGLDSGDERPLASPSLGDVRLRAKLHVEAPWGFRLALLAIVTAPAGGESDFAATSGPTIEPRFAGSYEWRWLALAVDVGYRFAASRTLATTRFGNELAGGLAASAGAWRLRGIVELSTAAGASELRGALRAVLPRNCSVDVGAGAGLGHQPTTPEWRAFAILRYGG